MAVPRNNRKGLFGQFLYDSTNKDAHIQEVNDEYPKMKEIGECCKEDFDWKMVELSKSYKRLVFSYQNWIWNATFIGEKSRTIKTRPGTASLIHIYFYKTVVSPTNPPQLIETRKATLRGTFFRAWTLCAVSNVTGISFGYWRWTTTPCTISW